MWHCHYCQLLTRINYIYLLCSVSTFKIMILKTASICLVCTCMFKFKIYIKKKHLRFVWHSFVVTLILFRKVQNLIRQYNILKIIYIFLFRKLLFYNGDRALQRGQPLPGNLGLYKHKKGYNLCRKEHRELTTRIYLMNTKDLHIKFQA